MAKKRILLAAGGTGGHLFPAFALTEELKRRDVDVHIVTDERVDEMVGNSPADQMHVVPSATMKGKNPIALLKTALTLGRGVLAARGLLKKIKPDFVLGFGGYPTFPPLIAAGQLGIKTGLHDQNAVMGRANKMLANRVDVIATSFRDVKYLPENCQHKVRLTGNPVRDKVLAVQDVRYPELDLQLLAGGANDATGEGKFRILIFGGSQGARFFSDFFPTALAELEDEVRAKLSVVQQCRAEDLDRVRALYQYSDIDAKCEAFFDDLPREMSQSHLVISRSGASTVAELAVCGRPAIMVPLPHALDNDQLLNAKMLEKAGAGWILEQKDITMTGFHRQLHEFLAEPSLLQKAANAAKSVGKASAVVELADLVIESV
ncbi:MAG: UDP-N-acetylglucosamine--N-acetylmuramyl-(pentapeptide) pyrophosphoryl-undecaprenol N-acetylglucosamine transferase [Methyloligella sp.]|nr:MAG: UDP-N-acetylglucosamine--N-acetylmuramyl-(pentapeptide) pyrophosphoryl-undecaprenol N-acetylglucosamine transferase [Methyloligella sp.]